MCLNHIFQTKYEYLGYVLTREGIKPQTKKVGAILALLPPTNVKGLRRFLGIVQYYRDIWEKRSDVLAPLTGLVGECGTLVYSINIERVQENALGPKD